MAPFFAPGAKLDEETCRYFASFDVVISYLYDPDRFFAGNLEKAGVETLIEGPYRIDESEPWICSSRQLAAPLEQLALFLEDPFVNLSYGAAELEEARPLVAIHPGSGSPAKNWGLENWSDLVRRIHREHPETGFLIISGEAEHETIDEFLAMLRKGEVEFEHLHQLSLSDLGIRLQTVHLFLGHDSGISHLAASTGIDGFVLFGKTNPAIWSPQNPAFRSLQAPGHQLGELSPEMVWNHADFRIAMNALSDFPLP